MEGVAGILLAGGRSQRMGRDKASLPWHGSTLARRAAGLLARVAEPPVIAVCAPDQDLPPLPAWVEVVRDPEPGLGPLAGLAVGRAAAGPVSYKQRTLPTKA
jgi:molybdopterin-guanine dinucleotide biosynthesis protein A